MPSKTEDVEAKYGVVINFPNLELHSAAASGNLGLVHYALTHGQPVNSVLHGVLPLHAACSGGSVDVVKMLIERGANVNAPRLPRRYSDGRKSNAPSVGTAGSTPLHFAAANGHAPIVQILLACGAVSDKPDKNGMTPEALAEIQGHTEVIRVMRAWESLHPSEPYTASEGGDSETVDLGSPIQGEMALSEDGWYDGQTLQQPSRKGKERAFSFSSAKSELSVPAVKVKKSFEGFFRRTSRSGSLSSPNAEPSSPTPLRVSTLGDGTTSNAESSGLCSPFIDSAPSSPLPDIIPDHRSFLLSPDTDRGEGSNTPLTRVTSSDSTILGPPMAAFRASSPSSNRSGGSSTVLGMARPSRSESTAQETIDETESISSEPSEYEPALESLEPEETEDEPRQSADSDRPLPGQETASGDQLVQQEEAARSQQLRVMHTLPPRHTFSSRRPSLPSILEKAAHPGQTFRNAIRRDRHASESIPTIPEDPTQPKPGTFLRGRKQSNEPSPPHSAGRRFGTIKGFFRRGASPPSRSPSPPKQNAIHPDELDERLRRASLDMSQSEGSSADRDEVAVPSMTQSAPATKTRFFEDLSDNSDLRMAALASITPRLPTAPRMPAPVRKISGGVLVPSPLANELRNPDDISLASSSNPNFRRSKTEVIRGGTPSPRRSASGGLPIHTKRRSATLPSQPGVGMDWDEGVSLRRAAASEVIRRNSEKLRQAVEEAEARTEDGDSFVSKSEAQPSIVEQEQDTPHASDGEHDDGDLTPEATPTTEKTDPHMNGSIPEPSSPNRNRGASIGSFTTDSTRLSTPSVSTNRQLSIVSYDTGSERYNSSSKSPTSATDKIPLRALPNSVAAVRPRGNTSSSESSGTSGMNYSGLPSASTPSTSMTPPSALGIGKTSSISPVPEQDTHNELSEQRSPDSPRKALTRQEAKNLVKQNELDILQLAQLPQSLDSSRSLAAQLAAYGENHQLEQQIASEERKAKRRAARTASGATYLRDSDGTESYMTATDGEGEETQSQSGESSGGHTTGSSALRMSTPKHDKEGMYRVEAPKSTVPSINNIYDRRAAAYREKLQALTSIQPAVPSSLRHSRTASQMQSRSYSHGSHGAQTPHRHQVGSLPSSSRPRAFSSTSMHQFQPTSSSSSSIRHVSSPFPASTTSLTSRDRDRTAQRPSSKYTLHPPNVSHGAASTRSLATTTGTMHTANTGSSSIKPRRKTHPTPGSSAVGVSNGNGGPPPPIADIVNARFAGISPPPVPPISASPYVSIFSTKYSGAPHDGGDSDDSDSQPTRYTVIENDWRGGHVVKNENIEILKRNKWGQMKSAIGHLGRKTS